MYLKRISLHGFKSFPDKADFDFSPGVTCIVGPNGCGKSNLVDAFKWVLGEQSAKTLRGRQMSDMIFNGSSTRRASGMARIDLVFDNGDRMLPVDHQEVCVTRKLFRSGESEYLINNESARLKDVREVFLDTGIGANSYSIIEQGRVSRLLDASNLERRAIFEEAAGIARYKTRKKEAERKLERTQQNLLRVKDIIEEVQRRLRSVKIQAGKARRFKEFDERLRANRATFSLSEYRRLSAAIAEASRDAQEAQDAATAVRTRIDQSEARASDCSVRMGRVNDELSATEQQYMQVRADIATHEERIVSASRRIDEQRAGLESVAGRVDRLERQRAAHEARLAEIQSSAESLQTLSREVQEKIDALAERDKAVAAEMSEVRSRVEDEKAGLVDLMRRSTQLHNEVVSLTEHRKKLESEHHRLGLRDAAIGRELGEYLEQQAALNDKLADLNELIEQQSGQIEQKRAESRSLAERRTQLTEQISQAKQRRSALQSRLEVLDELHRKMEGVGAGVRAILQKKRGAGGGEDSGIGGLVGEAIEADVVHAAVIEAAIGDLDQVLVLSEAELLTSGSDWFTELPGRLTAMCLDRLPPVISDHHELHDPSVVGQALDFVRFDEKHDRLVRHLLAKTVVVDQLENALRLARSDVADRRFVTLAGEVVEANGCVSVGPPSSRAGLIVRKSERRDVAASMVSVESKIAALGEEAERAAREVAHVERVLQELQTAVSKAHQAKVEATSSLERVNEAVRRLSEERPLIEGEAALIERQIDETARRVDERSESASRLERENQERENVIDAHNRRIAELADERDRVQFSLTEARVEVGKLAEKRRSMADAIHQVRSAMQTAGDAIASARSEEEAARQRIEDSAQQIETARGTLARLSEESEGLEAKAVRLRREREQLRMEAEQLSATTKSARSELEGLESRVGQIQLAMQTHVVQRDDLVGRLHDELGLDLVELDRAHDGADEDLAAVQEEIAELREKIRRLGNVNLDAIKELEELEARDAFLSGQFDDLEASRRQLESLIRKLDDESVTRFTKAFKAIQEHFKGLFRRLFGGGKADIVLEDPDNPLECGIEILAKPPGKELQRISLMSGGEKTMTAIALVMSIFRAQPSPFAFLDEVDAALDEANNVRFNNIIREFLDRSQFIVVTHSKRTMSIADQLYGITMQEPGVSSRVSVRFEQATGDEPDEQTAVA